MSMRRTMQMASAMVVWGALLVGLAPAAEAVVQRAVTLSASPTTVDVDSPVTLRGAVSKSPRGTAVLLEERRGSRWVRLATARTSTSGGAYRATVRPDSVGPTTYRARVIQQRSGRRTLAAATSPARTVTVRPIDRSRALTLVVPGSLVVLEAYTVSGTITDTPAGRFVRIECRLPDRGWETCGSGRTTSDGRFVEDEFQIQAVGTYAVRATVPREQIDGGTLGPAVSATRQVRVYGADNSGATQLVSITDQDNYTESGTSDSSAISDDGRYVAFVSAAPDLLDGVDPEDQPNVFLRDTELDTTRLVSVSADGGPVTDSFRIEPIETAVSRTGRYVAFTSASPDLVAGDGNEMVDVFVRDMDTGTTELASRSSTGAVTSGGPDFAYEEISLSDDGRTVLFTSRVALVAEDVNDRVDVYVRDLAAQTTSLVTRNGLGEPLIQGGWHGALSGDGTRAVFYSGSENIGPAGGTERRGVYRRDLISGAVDQVYFSSNIDMNVVPTSLGLSANGDRVVYSVGTIYLWRAGDGSTTAVSRDVDGEPHGRLPSNVVISGDGSTVAFSSDLTNFVGGDDRGNPTHEAYVHEVDTGETTLASVRYDGAFSGVRAVGGSAPTGLSADGDRLSFGSSAPELIRGDDANGPGRDVYVRDLDGP